MPGVVQSSPPLAADAFHMAKADDDFQFKCLRFVVFREVDRRASSSYKWIAISAFHDFYDMFTISERNDHTLLCSDADAEPTGRLVEIASTPQEVDVN